MLALLLFAPLLVLARLASADPPDGAELEFLWQVNLARSDPAAWGHANGLGALLDAIAPRPPLAWNATLVDSAQAKAQEFVDYDYFAHESPVTGSPNALILNVFHYPLAGNTGFYFGPDCQPCVYGGFGNTGVESLASSYASDGGIVATPIGAARGLIGEICDVAGTPNTCGTINHRNHLLGAAALTAPMIESGAGHVVQVEAGPAGPLTTHYWVFHTGLPAGSAAAMPQFLTGVVYADADEDDRYDAGEGLGGVTVQANALATTSNSAGGWSLAVDDGSWDVTCSGGGLSGAASAVDVVVAAVNREVDCVSGRPAAIVDFVPEPSAAAAAAAVLASLAAQSARSSRSR
jgi:hypothetical protein